MSVNYQILNIIHDIEELNEETTTINENIVTINESIEILEDNKQNSIKVTDTIQISKLKTQYITMTLTGKDLQESLDNKEDSIDIYSNLILNSMYITPFTTKTRTSLAGNGKLRASILTVEDDTLGTINVGESISSLISTKQDKLTAGDNIVIDLSTNTISATGSSSVSQSELDSKQNILDDILENEIFAFKANLLNLNIDSGIFYYM